jgi:acetyltransferase-like isoleucine patch superfamily enzyme
MLKKLINYLNLDEIRGTDTDLLTYVFKAFCYKLRGKNLLVHQKVFIENLSNLEIRGVLVVGRQYIGFSHKNDTTFLNVKGRLLVDSKFGIGRGCRFYIGENAICHLKSGYISANTNFIIVHGIEIGEECAISWGCEFLDSDFHVMAYEGRVEKDPKIKIGNHVWIGSNTKILKGVELANNIIVASNSVVTKSFLEENILIAGNPAKIVRKGVIWGNQAKALALSS